MAKYVSARDKINARLVGLLFVLMIAAMVLMQCFWIVPPGHCGIKVRLGSVGPEPLEEGFCFIAPFLDRVVEVDLRMKKAEIMLAAATKDLQDVQTKAVLNYRLSKEKAPDVYKTIGLEYEQLVVDPGIVEIYKAEAAKFTAEELITKRSDVSQNMFKAAKERFAIYGVLVESVSIVEFNFSAEFNRAIEAKVTAEQRALQTEKELEQAKFEAQKAVTKAQGEADAVLAKAKAEAEAMELKTKVITQPILALEAIQAWDGRLPTHILGDAVTPILNVDSQPSQANLNEPEKQE